MLYTEFQAPEQKGSEKEYFVISMVRAYVHRARSHLGPWDLGLNKPGQGPPGKATYQS